jgi:hypothetical protein
MELLHHTDHIEIRYDPESKILHCRWRGKQTTEGIQKAGAVILKITQERKIEKVLNDNSAVVGSWQDAAGWASLEWFPDMIAAGLRHFAWILPTNIFSELSVKGAMAGLDDVVMTFDNYDKAHEWLIGR